MDIDWTKEVEPEEGEIEYSIFQLVNWDSLDEKKLANAAICILTHYTCLAACEEYGKYPEYDEVYAKWLDLYERKKTNVSIAEVVKASVT